MMHLLKRAGSHIQFVKAETLMLNAERQKTSPSALDSAAMETHPQNIFTHVECIY